MGISMRVMRHTIDDNAWRRSGLSTLDEIRLEILRHGQLELLIDATGARNVSIEVSRQWTEFFARSRSQLKRVSVLTGRGPATIS